MPTRMPSGPSAGSGDPLMSHRCVLDARCIRPLPRMRGASGVTWAPTLSLWPTDLGEAGVRSGYCEFWGMCQPASQILVQEAQSRGPGLV